jgi:hypothetical protein
VQYRFLVNNSIWVNDPENPKTGDDGKGNVNSLVEAVTCNTWTCPDDAPSAQAFDWRDAVLYFVFVDRFLDGDPGNNCTVPNAEGPGQYQGGDWKGVTQRITDGYFTQLATATPGTTATGRSTSTASSRASAPTPS